MKAPPQVCVKQRRRGRAESTVARDVTPKSAAPNLKGARFQKIEVSAVPI